MNADVKVADYEGNTPLHLACIYNQEVIIKYLIQYKAPLKVTNSRGQTPLDLGKERLL